jgi:hypothetical protein
MVLIIAIFVAKLFSPVLIVLGVLVGWFSAKWWHVIAGAVVAAIADEALLHSMLATRRVDPGVIFIGFLAAAIWGFAIFAIKQLRRAKAP